MPSIFITGANRGLGLEFARQYAAAGWEVTAACRRPGNAVALKALPVEVVALDVTDFAAISAVAAGLSARTFDVLLNNAGVNDDAPAFGELDAEMWERVLRTNIIAPLKVAEAFLPHILAGERKIMAFLSSALGSIAGNASGGSYAYRSSKAGLNAAVKNLACDLAPKGIIPLLLHPGWVRTDMGGAGAPLDAPTSVTGLRRVIDQAKSGTDLRLLDYTGATLPW